MKIRHILAAAFLSFSIWAQPAAESVEEPRNDPRANAAYAELEKLFRPPNPPAEWRQNPPSTEERNDFYKKVGEQALLASGKAKEFLEKYPNHPRAADAKRREEMMRQIAARYGAARDESFEGKARALQAKAMQQRPQGMDAVLDELQKGARELQKEFPKEPRVYDLLLMSARETEGSKPLLEEIAASEIASQRIKDQAALMLKKMSLLGKPLDLRFTSLQGKEVDLSKMKGKVVLIDFWATWCGPCIVELPNVKAAYQNLHPKGFDIIGISFDESEAKLKNLIEKEEMRWPQYFDGQGWKNKFGQEFGINSIPSMWLVDKKGIVRDLSARADLESKVEKLLAENAE